MVTIKVNGQTITVANKPTVSAESLFASVESIYNDITKAFNAYKIASNVKTVESFGYKTTEGFGDKLKSAGKFILDKIKQFLKMVGTWILKFLAALGTGVICAIGELIEFIQKMQIKLKGRKLKGIKVYVHQDIFDELTDRNDPNSYNIYRNETSTIANRIAFFSNRHVEQSIKHLQELDGELEDLIDNGKLDADEFESLREKSHSFLRTSEIYEKSYSEDTRDKDFNTGKKELVECDAQELYNKIYNNNVMRYLGKDVKEAKKEIDDGGNLLKKETDKLNKCIEKFENVKNIAGTPCEPIVTEIFKNLSGVINNISASFKTQQRNFENANLLLNEVKDSLAAIQKAFDEAGVGLRVDYSTDDGEK